MVILWLIGLAIVVGCALVGLAYFWLLILARQGWLIAHPDEEVD